MTKEAEEPKSILEKTTNEVINDIVEEILSYEDREVLRELPDLKEEIEKAQQKNTETIKEFVDTLTEETEKLKSENEKISEHQQDVLEAIDEVGTNTNSAINNLQALSAKLGIEDEENLKDSLAKKLDENEKQQQKSLKEIKENLTNSISERIEKNKKEQQKVNQKISDVEKELEELEKSQKKKLDSLKSDVSDLETNIENTCNRNVKEIMGVIGVSDDLNLKEHLDKIKQSNQHQYIISLALCSGLLIIFVLLIIQMVFF